MEVYFTQQAVRQAIPISALTNLLYHSPLQTGTCRAPTHPQVQLWVSRQLGPLQGPRLHLQSSIRGQTVRMFLRVKVISESSIALTETIVDKGYFIILKYARGIHKNRRKAKGAASIG